MKAYTASPYSSASSCVSQHMQEGEGEGDGRVTKSIPSHNLHKDFSSALHSVRKHNIKPWKLPIAPMPPVRSKVYKVDPVNFRDLVQKLTGLPAAQSGSRRQQLKSTTPPVVVTRPLVSRANIAEPVAQPPMFSSNIFRDLFVEKVSDHGNEHTKMASSERMDSQGVSSISSSSSLSPSSQNWYPSPLLSPGTLSSLEHRVFL